MADNVPDWASGTTASNVPQTTPNQQTPSWANAQEGVPAWATRTPEQIGGKITDPDNGGVMGVLGRVGKTIQGAYESADLNGFGGFVTHQIDKLDGYAGTPWSDANMEKFAPGQDPAVRKQIQESYERANILQKRQQAQQQVEQNSQGFNPAAFVGGVAGSADPSWAINPAEGVVKNLAINGIEKTVAKVAVNAGAHAVMGSADDAAYQIADQVDGLKKNFDIKQNLQAAGFNAAFGAVHPIVSDFVTNLYKDRGMDTTPSADPRTVDTTPMSGEPMSAADQQQYQQLLHTGSTDDIKTFFDKRNGPQPSWEQVNQWTKYRDSVPEGYAQEEFQPKLADEQQPVAPVAAPVDEAKQAATDHIQAQTASWKNAPDFEVINHVNDIQDPTVRQYAIDQGADDGKTMGFVGPDNKVRIFAGMADNPETLNSVIYHEGLGHFGLQQKFGTELDRTLQTLMTRNVGKFNDRVDQWISDNPDSYNGDRTRAAEEVLAEDSENGQIKPTTMDAVSAGVRRIGRQMGLNLAYSDNEIRTILGMAHSAVVNGVDDARTNGFQFNPFSGQNRSGLRFMKSDDLTPKNDEIESLRIRRIRDNILNDPDIEPEYKQSAIQARTYGEKFPPQEHLFGNLWNATRKLTDNDPFNETRSTGINDNIRFMRKSDTSKRDQASGSDYVANDLEGIYKSLDEGYTPNEKTWEENRRSALELGFKPSQIRDLGDIGDLSTRLYRMQSAANMADIKLTALNEKLGTPDWSMRDQAEYLKTIADRDTLIKRIKGDKAEYARALNVSKAASSYTNATMEQIAEKLREEGSGLAALADDPVKFMKFAQWLKGMMQNGNKAGANAAINGVNKPYWEQYLNTFHMNAMLSALSTHVKAPMDMMTGISRDVIERALAVPVGKAWNLAEKTLGKPVKEGIQPSEVIASLYGTIRSVFSHNVYQQMLHAAKTGEGSYVTPNQQISRTNMQRYGTVGNPNIPGVSVPSNLISAQDTFFRSVAMGQNLYALGTRQAHADLQARGGKFTLDDVMSLGSSYAHNPTIEMVSKSKDLTDRTLLLNNNALNAALNKYRVYTPGMSPAQRVGTFIVSNLAPFIRVESNNLINRVIQRSPLGFLDKYTQQQLKMGGPEAHIALTKILYGTTLMGMSWMAADKAKNYLTGESSDNPDKSKEMSAGGFEPRAVHENGRYNQSNSLSLSVNPLDQHNATATMMAGLRQSYDEGFNKGQIGMGIKLALGGLLHDLAGSSWVSDVAPAVDALTARGSTAGQKVAQFAGDEAKTWVPGIANQANRVLLDKNQRDTNTTNSGDISGQVVNDVKSAIPGVSKTLPTKYTVYGDPAPTGADWSGVHTWVSHGNGKQEVTDPPEKELFRLAQVDPKAVVTPVQKSVHINGTSVKLTPEQFEDYQHYTGRTIVETLRSQMSDPSWSKMSDSDKISYVKDLQKQAKSEVRDALVQKEGWLNDSQIKGLQQNGQ